MGMLVDILELVCFFNLGGTRAPAVEKREGEQQHRRRENGSFEAIWQQEPKCGEPQSASAQNQEGARSVRRRGHR